MEKKNPFKFTLGFDKTKASHIRAVELLNSVKDKADLIAEAIAAHVMVYRKATLSVMRYCRQSFRKLSDRKCIKQCSRIVWKRAKKNRK